MELVLDLVIAGIFSVNMHWYSVHKNHPLPMFSLASCQLSSKFRTVLANFRIVQPNICRQSELNVVPFAATIGISAVITNYDNFASNFMVPADDASDVVPLCPTFSYVLNR